jgi:hypothetical protein
MWELSYSWDEAGSSLHTMRLTVKVKALLKGVVHFGKFLISHFASLRQWYHLVKPHDLFLKNLS